MLLFSVPYAVVNVRRNRWPRPAGLPKPSEGLQTPFVSDAVVFQDVQIAIIRTLKNDASGPYH